MFGVILGCFCDFLSHSFQKDTRNLLAYFPDVAQTSGGQKVSKILSERFFQSLRQLNSFFFQFAKVLNGNGNENEAMILLREGKILIDQFLESVGYGRSERRTTHNFQDSAATWVDQLMAASNPENFLFRFLTEMRITPKWAHEMVAEKTFESTRKSSVAKITPRWGTRKRDILFEDVRLLDNFYFDIKHERGLLDVLELEGLEEFLVASIKLKNMSVNEGYEYINNRLRRKPKYLEAMAMMTLERAYDGNVERIRSSLLEIRKTLSRRNHTLLNLVPLYMSIKDRLSEFEYEPKNSPGWFNARFNAYGHSNVFPQPHHVPHPPTSKPLNSTSFPSNPNFSTKQRTKSASNAKRRKPIAEFSNPIVKSSACTRRFRRKTRIC